jgi:8-oxo-dGTP diphosphatase
MDNSSSLPEPSDELQQSTAPIPHPASERPKVGVGVVVLSRTSSDETDAIRSPKSIWVGRRKGSHGRSKLALPGGHLEYGESWAECAIREVQEEMGVTLSTVEFLHVTNDIMWQEKKHYITIFMVGELHDPVHQRPQNLEPEKCEGWEPYQLSELLDLVDRNELFLPLETLLKEMPDGLRRLSLLVSSNIASTEP